MVPGMAACGHYVKGFVCIVFFNTCSNLVSKSFYFPIWSLTKPMVKWFAKVIPLASVETWIWTQVFLVPYKHLFLLWRWKLSWQLFKAKYSASWTTSKWSVMQLGRRLGLGEKKPDSIPSCLHPLISWTLGQHFLSRGHTCCLSLAQPVVTMEHLWLTTSVSDSIFHTFPAR